MGAFLSGVWVRLAAAAAIVGAAIFFLARVFRAGGDAERAKSAQAALDHQSNTATAVSRSDAALADPSADRAARVRKRFQRQD
jgi:hypothetical protein